MGKNQFSNSSKNKNLSVLISGISLVSFALAIRPVPLNAANESLTVSVFQKEIKEITGIVTDEKGDPLIGASILIKGEKTGTVTDIDGKFVLDGVSPGKTLIISYVGYLTKEIKAGNQTSLKITLQDDSKQLDDVVVVGYGTQKKATVTGSVSSVKGEEIKRSPEANVTNSLVGRLTGVIANNRSGEPGSDYSEILIRGKATFGNTQPLFVIDGVANRYGNIDRLNPSDIESLTVLKDASAAIYGAQAANGVILVTTKRGNASKPTISYEGSFSLSQNTRTPKLMNAYQYMVYEDEIAAVDFPMDPTKQKFKDIKGKYLDGTIDRRMYDDTDWMGVVFQKAAPKTQHSLSVRGGNDRIKYYMSGAYLYQEPCYKDTPFDFSTFQLRSNIDATITKNLTVSMEMATRQEKRNESNYSTGNLFWEAFNAYPYLPDYYENGLPGPGLAWGGNIALLVQGGTGYYKVRDNHINSKIGFDLKMPWLLDGLYVNGFVAWDKMFRTEKTLMGMWDAYRFNPQTEAYDNIRDITGQGNINLSQSSQNNTLNTFLIKLGYEKRFGSHNVNAFVAYEQSKEDKNWHSGWRRDFLSTRVDYLFAGSDKEKTNDGSAFVFARQNYFGRLSYAFRDRYMAEFTMRIDGSMNFPKHNRWGYFPGLSLGWRMSEEAFMRSLEFINELKIKGSVGKLGNDRVDAFQYLTSYNLNPGAILGYDPTRTKGFTVGRTPNANITWEEATTYNIGFESQFLAGMFTLEAQYFYSKRDKILLPRRASIPVYTGLQLPDENIGKVDNQGVEVELMHRQRIKDWTYYVGGNMTFARNKIVFVDEAPGVPEWQKQTGYPMDSYLVYLNNGIIKDNQDLFDTKPRLPNSKPGDLKYKNIDDDNSITDRDKMRIYESPIPQIVYGISMGVSWKGIELNMLWQGQAKAKTMIMPYTYNRDETYYTNRWISNEETPNAKYPRAFSKNDPINTLPSDFWLKDASFLRLKNLELAYSFKKEWLQKIKVQSARILLSGSNLLTFDNIKILDPEGLDSGGLYFPQQRIYNIGLNLSF